METNKVNRVLVEISLLVISIVVYGIPFVFSYFLNKNNYHIALIVNFVSTYYILFAYSVMNWIQNIRKRLFYSDNKE